MRPHAGLHYPKPLIHIYSSISCDEPEGAGCHAQVNVVVMRGVNDDELGDFVELTRDKAINVRFIEYMPFDGNVWSDTKMVTYKQMMAAVQQRFPDGLQRVQVRSALCMLLLECNTDWWCDEIRRLPDAACMPFRYLLIVQPMLSTVAGYLQPPVIADPDLGREIRSHLTLLREVLRGLATSAGAYWHIRVLHLSVEPAMDFGG